LSLTNIFSFIQVLQLFKNSQFLLNLIKKKF
jgi:hypothetical protein